MPNYTERPFKQRCDSCDRMRTTLPSLALEGGWRSFADWWMCPTCSAAPTDPTAETTPAMDIHNPRCDGCGVTIDTDDDDDTSRCDRVRVGHDDYDLYHWCGPCVAEADAAR